MKSLSHDEAATRSALLSVDRYDVELDLTGMASGDLLRSRTTAHITCSDAGGETFIDCVGTPVAATLNGRPIDVAAAAEGRLPLSGLSATNVLVVDVVQNRTSERAGVHRAVDPSDGLVYVWTSFEPDEARRVFACFDQPDLKAPFAFTVTAPASWTVVSNSPEREVVDSGPDARRWVFAETPPLSTYVPVVNAGPFVERRQRRDGYDLGLYARRSLAPYLDRDADELFDVTAAGLGFFGERFAMAFPQEKYDQVFVPDLGGAMENYGCVTWSDEFVYRRAPSEAEREMRAFVLLHEMAHMWFGDIVTMRWWDDLWLNEAFADWAAVWATASVTEHVDAWASFLATRKETGYAADRAPTTHPIRQDVPDVAAAAASFDMVTYAKGASVLKQLVAHVGEEAFVDGLRSYFRAHAWGNATLDDLVAHLTSASGRDLTGWTHDWLDTAGTNVLELSATVEDGRYADVRVQQRAPEAFPVLRRHTVRLGVYRRADGAAAGLERRSVVDLELRGAETPVPELAGAERADLLLLNDDDLTFAELRVDAASVPELLDRAPMLPTATSRLLAVSVARNLVVAGELPTAAFVRVAARVVAVETSDAVVEQLLAAAIRMAELWSPEAERASLVGELADAAARLADGAESRRLFALRALASTATTDEHVERLRAAAADDIDLHWRLLVRLAVLDRLDESEVAAVLEADPDPDAWVRALTVRAAGASEAAKREVWDAFAVERRVPAGVAGDVARAFWQRAHEPVLRDYAELFLDLLRSLTDTGMIESLVAAHLLFPVVGVDASYVDRVLAVAASDGVPPVARGAVAERVDELRRMLRARSIPS